MKKLKIKSIIFLASLLLSIVLAAPISALADCKTSATPDGKTQATAAELQQCLKNNSITTELNNIVNFLSAGVGIVVAGVVILGGIQYTLAGSNTTALTNARQRIINGLIALVTFMFIYAFLQWIIPGGVFG